MTTRRRRWLLIGALLAVTGSLGALAYHQATLYPKRFAPVVEGRLYRSGEVTGAQLARLQRDFGIRRVISLLSEGAPETRAEQAAAARLGLEWHNIPMGGSGQSTPAARARVLGLLADPDAPPTLVHCAAGTNRTGLAVGLYRIHCEGWSYDDVLAEMRRFSFDDLPKHQELRDALAEAAEAARVSPDGSE